MRYYEQDRDVVRWGLHLLDVCSLSNSGSPGSVTHYDHYSSESEYVSEGYCDVPRDNVENDETIAHAFQEELKRVADAEALGSLHVEGEDREASVLSQDWLGYSNRHHSSEGVEDPRNYEEPDQSDGVDQIPIHGDESWSPEIVDEYILDGEVGKRLNQMNRIPHVPKTNGEIPSTDEATSDHQRLLDRLELYDLVELKIAGDGNCQFRSLSDQIYRSADHHKFVREQVINQLESHRELYENYVPMAYDDYLKKMRKNGEWGDHVTLQAAADSFGIKIFVITSYKHTCYIEILPRDQKSKRIIFLSFWAEVHYNSIYPRGEFPLVETKKKKRWWQAGMR